MFHVERCAKTLSKTGVFVFFAIIGFVACVTPRHTVAINEYTLLPNGKEITGREEGLTAFIFENDQRKMPFQQFIMEKYRLGYTEDISYNVTLENHRFIVYLYTHDEMMKYFDLSQFMVTRFETAPNRVGSSNNFIGVSVADDHNGDALADDSLYREIVIKYLRQLKDEYYNS